MEFLTDDQIKSYWEKGYLLTGKQLFDEKDFIELNNIFEQHLDNANSAMTDELDTPHFKDERLFKFLLHNNVLDIVESLIGPNIGLFSSHFISKEPYTGRKTPWHEDSAYWKDKFDSFDKIITIWLAIDDVSIENGCMGVIPGTHKNGFSIYEKVDPKDFTFESQIKQELVDESKVVWFELAKGTYSLHDSRIIHGANANTSPRRRCGYTMLYFSLDMKYLQNDSDFKIYHARGNNIAGNKLIYR
jgi:ectoine hydroxylase-related dioxygenase (phytanoyl-CoA dioxygenase family)